MDKKTRIELEAVLYTALIAQISEVKRTLFLLTGTWPDTREVVRAMEESLRTQCERIDSTKSSYSPEELEIRKEIAREVVALIQRTVE